MYSSFAQPCDMEISPSWVTTPSSSISSSSPASSILSLLSCLQQRASSANPLSPITYFACPRAKAYWFIGQTRLN